MHDDPSIPDLISPNFVRGDLAQQEQRAITSLFAGHVQAVLHRINDGKEATVWLCSGAADTVPAPLYAAKMYRARKFRAFTNDATYARERNVRDRRLAKAMRQRSRVGSRASQVNWVAHEWEMLVRMHAAGVAVPAPIAHAEAGVLMAFVGDEHGAAPRLADARPRGEVARELWQQMCAQLARMLDCGVVHGDLSACNVLVHEGRAVLIDLPQSISTAASDAHTFFTRDMHNLASWFERAGVDTEVDRTIDRLWRGTR